MCFLINFLFYGLSIGVSGVLKTPTIIALLSIYPFIPVSILLCIEMFICLVHKYLQLLCLPLDWSLDHYVVSFLLSCNLLILRSILSDMRISSHLHGIYFSILSLSLYTCSEVWSGFLVDSIYMGLVFVSIQPVCVFWLEYLIHFHLK